MDSTMVAPSARRRFSNASGLARRMYWVALESRLLVKDAGMEFRERGAGDGEAAEAGADVVEVAFEEKLARSMMPM